MKKFKSLTYLLLIFISRISCGSGQNASETEAEIPEALQDNKPILSDLSKRSYYEVNLVEDLYKELLKDDNELQEIERALYKADERARELSDEFRKYDTKSENYYSSAFRLSQTINDSLLSKKLNEVINRSQERYTRQTNELRTLVTQMNNKQIAIEDQHKVMKILITLPVMEKYQKENAPDKSDIKEHMKTQEEVGKKIEKQASLD